MSTRSDILARILACPACHGKLDQTSDQMTCRACGTSYPITNTIPVLLTPAHKELIDAALTLSGKAMVDEYTGGGVRSLLRKLTPPQLLFQLEPDLAGRQMDFFYQAAGQDSVVISVGGGPIRHRPEDININIGLFPNVDLIGDGHQLPLADASIDAIICKAVLEHVECPDKIVAEIRRVLKPGGMVYVDIPFLFITHYYPLDISRFTAKGVEHLMRDFTPVKLGASVGPFSTILMLINDFIIEVLKLRNHPLRKLVSGVFRTFFFPFKYLDHFYRNTTTDFAGAYHFVGRRK